jgi:hypothetical protein
MIVSVDRRQAAGAVVRHPAVIVFALLWLASALAIALLGGWEIFIFRLPAVAGFLSFTLITLWITRPAPAIPAGASVNRARLLAQLAIIGLIVGLTAFDSLAFHGISPLASPLFRLRPLLGQLANPVFYFLVPLPILLLLGARPIGLGFGRGHRAWRVIALWCALPVLYWLFGLATGTLAVGALLRALGSHAIQNGFFEEFLFRGALQTRLRHLLSPVSAIVISALVFGLWHIGAAMVEVGSLAGAIAVCIYSTSVYGLAFGVLMERTRNLLAPSLVHVVTNALG